MHKEKVRRRPMGVYRIIRRVKIAKIFKLDIDKFINIPPIGG